ncbi:hypothetical protein F66182_10198 [Fusarium sp. NRRL 66182]|nr:hypothetical protein F66182_10198 [Fusarium sp. NRRL 66182]
MDMQTAKSFVLQLYQSFDVLAASPAVIASVVMASDRSPEAERTVFTHLATGLFTSTIITSVTALTLNKMVLFQFEGSISPTQRETWAPLGLIDVSIVKLLGGLVFWSVDKYPIWITIVIGIEAILSLLGLMALSMKMSRRGYLDPDLELDGNEAEDCRTLVDD